MGTVPNAVFERILDAVNANNSAEVMTVANQLLDAGNSPAQLARQAVRYLRNTLIAKITQLTPEADDPAAAELLQISPDEQRRAARSAALFTEEELTRFLQTMLRTFDELGYRQEQRFHFELGLLKLVHLRRLLPVEEVLSQLANPQSRPAAAKPTPPSPARPTSPATVEPVKPAFSPFAADNTRRRFEGIPPGHTSPGVPSIAQSHRAMDGVSVETKAVLSSASVTALPVPPPIPVPDPLPVAPPVPVPPPDLATSPQPPVVPPAPPAPNVLLPSDSRSSSRSEAEGSAVESLTGSADSTPATHLQTAAVEALATAKQSSASDAIADATFTLTADTLTIQTDLSKTMLPVVLNSEAEKLLRTAITQAHPTPLKLTLLPATPATKAEKKPRAPRSGSAQAKALEHPVVQRAQSLFHAEIRNVIDLRGDD